VLARTGGSPDEALRLGREAVAIANQIDQPMLRADSRIDLADVLDALGEHSECAKVVAEALAIGARKGMTPPARRLRALGIDVAAPGSPGRCDPHERARRRGYRRDGIGY